MSDDEAGNAGCEHAGEAREHEAVVQYEAADFCGAGTVEADAGKVRRIGRKEEVAVASRNEGQDHDRVHAYVQSDRHDDGNGCALGIDELGCQEQDERIRPWVFGDSSAEECLQDCHVVGKVCISHPCNAVNGYECDDACAEDLAVADFLGFGVADEEDDRRNEEHDHLDDGCHGNGFHLAFGISEVREQIREIAEDCDAEDADEENDGSVVVRRRKFLALQGFVFTVHIFLLFRIFDHFLEFFVVSEVLASFVAHESSCDDADQGCRNGYGKNLEQGVGIACSCHESDDGNDSNGYRGCRDAHLGCDGRNGHRAFRTDIFLDGNIINDREHGVDDMACAAEDSQEPCGDRSQNRDMLRVISEEAFRILQHDGQTAGCLQEACAGNNCHDCQHNADRRAARLVSEKECISHQTDAADDRQSDPAMLDSKEQAGKEYHKS